MRVERNTTPFYERDKTMTTSYTYTPAARKNTVKHIDRLRVCALLSTLLGAFWIVLTAGGSDAGLFSVGGLLLRLAGGGALILLGRALNFFASELFKQARK